jgi:hypothetical protein
MGRSTTVDGTALRLLAVSTPKRRNGPEAERLKIDLPLAEGLRRLVRKPKP